MQALTPSVLPVGKLHADMSHKSLEYNDWLGHRAQSLIKH